MGALAVETQQAGPPHQLWGVGFWPPRPYHNHRVQWGSIGMPPGWGAETVPAPALRGACQTPGGEPSCEPSCARTFCQRSGAFPLTCRLCSSVPFPPPPSLA